MHKIYTVDVDKWAEVRTAFYVAELGTISAAAKALGLHRATVVRHIESLEREMGSKIFQRHSRGYAPTELGRDLLNVARTTEDHFNQLVRRARHATGELTGDFVVTSHEHVARLLIPALARFQAHHPALHVRYLASAEVLRLEYGAAHVALRSGPKPSDQDNVVRAFPALELGLYAHPIYVERCGLPAEGALEGHSFVRWDTSSMGAMGMPFAEWFETQIEPQQIVLSSPDLRVAEQGVMAGMGMGFFTTMDAQAHPELCAALPPLAEWTIPLWIVTHVDLHRTRKVQAFLKTLYEDL